MKKIVALFMTLLLCFGSVALADTLSLDLSTASDQELIEAMNQIIAEQKSRIKASLTLDQSSLTLPKGKKDTLTASLTGLDEGAAPPKLTWTTSDKSVATVNKGQVSAINGGTAVITCSAVLPEGIELSASCSVNVIVQATSVKAKKSNLTLEVGNTASADITISPANATEKALAYSSSDTSVATVSKSGTITAVGSGKCQITAATIDGSEKKAVIHISVSAFKANSASLTVYSKKGSSFSIQYFGNRNNLNVSVSGGNAEISYSLLNQTLTFDIVPVRAGSLTITCSDKSNSSDKIKLSVTIDHNAVYSSVSYPAIQYSDASRYPSQYKGDCVSFSGKVLQVISGYGYTAYRISSRGNYDNVVYVTLDDANVTTPIIEDDRVTVYGTYAGNYTYSTIFGAEITIPQVKAERINVK